MIDFRPYQLQCFENVKNDIDNGYKRLLLQLPTGAGKTICLSNIIDNVIPLNGKQAVIFVHREELLFQTVDKFKRVHGNKFVIGMEMGSYHCRGDEDIIVASTATLGRAECKRIQKIDPNRVGIVMYDEVHHAICTTGQNSINYFLDKNKQAILIGCTATTVRSDGLDIAEIFEVVSYRKSLIEMIREGWLANIRGYVVRSHEDLNGIKTQAGDFAAGELERRVNTDNRNQLIFDAYNAYMKDRHGVVIFCAGVEHAQDITDMFNQNGISAATINHKTPKDERRNILKAFEAGEIKVLPNMGVLTEGWDSFEVGGLIMARPTKSSLLFVQMIGRSLRLDRSISPWKSEAVIVDIVDSYKAQTQKTVASVAGAMKVVDVQGKTLTEIEEIFEKAQTLGIDISVHADVSGIEERFIEKNLIAEFELVDKKLSEYKWFAINANGKQEYVITLPDGAILTIREDILGRQEIEYQRSRSKAIIAKNIRYFEEAFKIADMFIDYNFGAPEKVCPECRGGVERTGSGFLCRKCSKVFQEYELRELKHLMLLKRDQKWHGDKATEKQVEFMKKLGIPVPDDLTKGEAGRLIDQKIASKKKGRK